MSRESSHGEQRAVRRVAPVPASAQVQKPKTVNLAGAELVLGRDPTCSHVLNYPMISWRHARVLRSGKEIFLEDLGSTNGTFVNGTRIRGRVLVRPGSTISLGSFSLTLTPDGKLHERDLRGNLIIEARDICVDIPGRRILEHVSLVIHPGELVGLMGTSGAGKTTLLNALNGYVVPSQGEVLLNGQSIYGSYREIAPFLGYVPQDDIIHSELTVFESLYYSARLRLPSDTSDEEIEARIRTVLRELGLEGTQDTLIGSAEKRGISGGQRKRVNLAMELLTDPMVLFLDEPTTGLSSQDAEVVVKALRRLANQGKSILVTIHQPGMEVFRLLDSLVMLAKDGAATEPARLAYYGPAYPDGIAFFTRAKPDKLASSAPEEIFHGMARRPAAEWEKAYRSSSYFRNYVLERRRPGDDASAQAFACEKPAPSFFFQWFTLVRRGLTIKLKDRFNTGILLLQAPVVAVLIVLVFGKQVTQPAEEDWDKWQQVFRGLGITLFLMALAGVWFGASNSVREIVGEWSIYRRERMVNLSIPAYIASKFAILGGLALVQCLILLGVAFLGCKLRGSPLTLLSLLLVGAFIGITVGLVLSAVARTSEMAIAILPIILLGMVILGGVMQPIHRMHQVTQYLAAVNPARWCFEGMIVLESEKRPLAPPTPSVWNSREAKDMAEHYFPKESQRSSTRWTFLALSLLLLLCAAASPIILRLRDLPSMVMRERQDHDSRHDNET